MTKKEAIEIINAMCRSKDCGYLDREIREALDIAIKAIKENETLLDKVRDDIVREFFLSSIMERYTVDKCLEIIYKYKTERKQRIKEATEMLTSLKERARRGITEYDTEIKSVNLDSFNFVINNTIKLLEEESEEKNEATK